MAMGWWKPYFFTDTSGVQLLLSPLQIGGLGSLLLATVGVGLLCLLDRWAAAEAAAARRRLPHLHSSSSSSAGAVTVVAACWWTLQRLTGGLVMLLMMTFNLLIFLEVVTFLGTR
jgi:hypothetical protein